MRKPHNPTATKQHRNRTADQAEQNPTRRNRRANRRAARFDDQAIEAEYRRMQAEFDANQGPDPDSRCWICGNPIHNHKLTCQP